VCVYVLMSDDTLSNTNRENQINGRVKRKQKLKTQCTRAFNFSGNYRIQRLKNSKHTYCEHTDDLM
jgi:hypothetical protein